MPNCTAQDSPEVVEFGRLGRRVVEGRFDGGSMTRDGGVLLLGATDRKLDLIDVAAMQYGALIRAAKRSSALACRATLPARARSSAALARSGCPRAAPSTSR